MTRRVRFDLLVLPTFFLTDASSVELNPFSHISSQVSSRAMIILTSLEDAPYNCQQLIRKRGPGATKDNDS